MAGSSRQRQGFASRSTLLLLLASVLACQDRLQGVEGAYWGSISEDGCVFPGQMRYYARLWDIKGDWRSACWAQEAIVNGYYFRSPNFCDDKGISGMWGVWFVTNSDCDPHWSNFKDDGCRRNGCRQYSSILWDIPSGLSWEQWCSRSWAEVKGRKFTSPTRCVNTGLNMWGEFDVAAGCGQCYAGNNLVAGASDEAGHGGTPPLASPSSSPSDSPSET